MLLQAIAFYILLPVLYGFSLLPLKVLYVFSDLVYALLYHVIGYRKKVVRENLRNAFPGKSAAELHTIEKAFYQHFCDLLVETIRLLTISEKQLLKHCRMEPASAERIAQNKADRQNTVFLMGHMGNWEWAGCGFSVITGYPLYVIYHPLSNLYMDRLMQGLRSRFGAIPVAMRNTARSMIENRDKLGGTVFIADQSPHPQGAYWTRFLHQDTAFFRGAEKMADKMKYPVLYMSISKLRRGYYEIKAIPIENEAQEEDGVIEKYVRMLEADIQAQPAIWLWTHRRWKHKR